MEVYVDEILVISPFAEAHIGNLARAFQIFRKYKIKLFGVEAENFLDFMISRQCIEANPEKVQALHNMEASNRQKDIQKLTRKVAALNRFVSKSV